MLLKSSISKIEIYSDEWYAHRLSKFTSSGIAALTAEKMGNEAALTYIYKKVGESLTGTRSSIEVDTEATQWGLAYETEGLKKFGEQMGLKFITTQTLIWNIDSLFASTPDALIVRKESTDGLAYDVSTVEIKCPPTFNNYIPLWFCETPEDVKRFDRKYYWQVIDQMDNCDCLNGYFVVYHPEFKAANFKAIEFRKINLMPDFKFLKERKKWAEQKFNEIRDKMLSVPCV